MEAKNYDAQFLEMGRRLKALREEPPKMSHATLSKMLAKYYNVSVKRDSLMSYEVSTPDHVKVNSKKGMSVEKLVALADLYDVSTDYILGRSDIKRADAGIRSACEYTGLSEDAVVRIRRMKELTPDMLDILGRFLADENFPAFAAEVSRYLRHKSGNPSNFLAADSPDGIFCSDFLKRNGYYMASRDEMTKIDFSSLTQILEKLLDSIA